MVLLTVTPAAKIAIDLYNDLNQTEEGTAKSQQSAQNDPSLVDVAVGDPVSHGQLIEVATFLRGQRKDVSSHELPSTFCLDHLLKGSRIYTPPPKPKQEPVRTFNDLICLLDPTDHHRHL